MIEEMVAEVVDFAADAVAVPLEKGMARSRGSRIRMDAVDVKDERSEENDEAKRDASDES